jgi:hypothetical protein
MLLAAGGFAIEKIFHHDATVGVSLAPVANF